MISFDNINKFDRRYDFYNHYLRFTHNYFYYKKFYVVGRENIPPRGVPTFVISNHQNALMDALAILYLFDDSRQPVFIARGDIFKRDFIARILRFLKIMPTFRTRDGNRSDIRSNHDTFDLAGRILGEGGTLAMFPEAGHQHGRYLSSFKKGYPRIAFRAEEMADFKLGLQILPLNIHYSDYFNFRSKLLVTVGKPFQIDEELLELYRHEPNKAYLELNEKSRAIIKEMTLDIEDPEFYDEYDQLRLMLDKPMATLHRKKVDYLPDLFQEDKKIIDNLDKMRAEQPDKFTTLMGKTTEYIKGLRQLKLRDWIINKKFTVMTLVLKAFLLLLTLPVFLFGFINNILPFQFSKLLKMRVQDKQFYSSLNYASGVLVAFPLMYIILLAVVWGITGHFWMGLIYVLLSLATLFYFYAYKIYCIKFWASCRYMHFHNTKNAVLTRLRELKKQIMEIYMDFCGDGK